MEEERGFPQREKKGEKEGKRDLHISPFFGGFVEKGVFGSIAGAYSYRALILALISLMISAISGEVLMMFSMRSMECITVV